MFQHLLFMSYASPKNKVFDCCWQGILFSFFFLFFQGKQNRICAYHPNCIASLIPWEHFFSFYSIVSFCCGCVCAVAQSTSAFCFPLRGLLLICELSLMGCFKGSDGGIYGFLVGCIYNSSCLTQKALKILNCTNLDCLLCSSASRHYLQSKMKIKLGLHLIL